MEDTTQASSGWHDGDQDQSSALVPIKPAKPSRPKFESFADYKTRTDAEHAAKVAAKKLAREAHAADVARERAADPKKHARDVAKANKSYPKRHAQWQATRDEATAALDYVTNFTPTDGEYFTTTANLIEQHAGPSQYVGGSQGISLPIGSLGGRSVRYRVGAARGHVEAGTLEDRVIDNGRVKVTADAFIFIGSNNTRSMPYAKLVDVTIDGTEVRISSSNRSKPTRLRISAGDITKFLLAAHLAQADLAHSRVDLVADITAQANEIAGQEPLMQV